MLADRGRPVLWRSMPSAAANESIGLFAGPFPIAISGLSGWWDAGSYAGMVDGNGLPLPGWGNPASSIVDKSGANANIGVYHQAGNGSAPQATPRLNGTLGGLGLNTVLPPAAPQSGMLLPLMDQDTGFSLASANLGSSVAWTLYFVWSRPNFVQGSSLTSIALLKCGGDVILSADAQSGSVSRLILFPGASQTVLTANLERRHTHSIIIRNTPGVGTDVWLDATQVATAAANPCPSVLAGPLLFLHSGAPHGAAQCWFHEAAIWVRALSASDVTTLLSCATRWSRGPRKGVQLVVMGQSNAGYSLTDGAWHLMAQGIAWHIGALAYNVIGLWGGGDSYTCVSGHGISNVPFSGFVVYPGAFLTDPEDGSDPANWPLGTDGTAVQTYLGSQLAIDLQDISLLVWPWTESDSARNYDEKARYENAFKRLLGLMRSTLMRSASSLPLMWWNAIPFGSGSVGGIQMVREVAAEVAGDPTQNVFVGLPQTADSNPRGSSWSPATGVSTGGDFNHRDATDNLRFGRLAAPVAARAVLAAMGGDTEIAIPSGIPRIGGPTIAHVYQAVANTQILLLTIVHDAGSDLIVPLLAAAGQGFAIMDGGTTASPGPIISAIACVRIDATHLQVTLASAPVNPQSKLSLFYPYGYGNIFRGNAVTDNFATVSKPTGWDIAADLGSAWALNCPLAATTTPMPVSADPS
jgi:hypothetical protein